MSRPWIHLIGPELVLAGATALVFWFCARHNSGAGRDVALMEKLIWAIPFLLTPVAFATIVLPGAKTWWWLGRAIVFSYAAIFVCGYRLISGLGSGSKGQDAAMILLVVLASVAVAVASAISGAVILASLKPAFASWFQAHKVLATILTTVAMLPIGFGLGITVTFVCSILLGIYCEFVKQ